MVSLARSELFRLTHRMMTRVTLLTIVVLVVGAYVLLWSTSGSLSDTELTDLKDHLRLANAPKYGMDIAYQIGVLVAVVLASSSIATEYGWGTVRTIVARTESRPAFLFAKLLSIAVFVAGIGIVGALSVFAGSAIVTFAGDLETGLGHGFAARSLLSPVRLCVVVTPYVALAFLLALWSKTTAAGIAVVVIAFYTEVLLTPLFEAGGAFSWFPEDLLIYRNITAILDVNAAVRDPSLPDAWMALGVLAAYSVGFLALAFWRFSSRDITLN